MAGSPRPRLEQEELKLPDGTLLLHIGPPKTGTTSLQGAFHLARAAARQQGVHYSGYDRHSATAVRAVVGLKSPWSTDRKPPHIRYWNFLAREVRGSDARLVVLSSEDFAQADEPTIRRIVGDLGDRRIHVVLTLRPLARLLPSQWQQNVQNRYSKPFATWLAATFDPDEKSPGAKRRAGFWRRHRDDILVRRWADVVGVANVTVIVLDDAEPERLYRTFEGLAGLSAGTLQVDRALANRSLTLPEVEAVRAFNRLYKAERLPKPLYTRVLRRGAAPILKRRQPPPGEPRLVLPAWAAERVASVAGEIAEGIAATGVHVIGDLESLARVEGSSDEAPTETLVPADVAATLAMGVLVATGAARASGGRQVSGGGAEEGQPETAHPYGEPPELFRVSTLQLGLVLVRRIRARLLHRVDRLLRRRRRDPRNAAG